MKKDLLGQLKLNIIHTDLALMHTSDLTKQAKLHEKLDSLEQKQDSVCNECESMSSTIGNLLLNPPQVSSAPLQTPIAPPGLIRNMLPPPTPTENSNPQLPLTPATSPAKRQTPPHMETPSPSVSPAKRSAPPHLELPISLEPTLPSKKKSKQSTPIVRQRSMSTRSTSLQVTSQQDLRDEDMDEVSNVHDDAKATTVSNNHTTVTTLTNRVTHIGPAEQLMMRNSITLRVPCVDKTNTSNMLISARGVRSGHKSHANSSSSNILPIFLLVCFLSFIQTTSAMSFRASSLSVYALNANGLVNLGKIAHINSAISARRPHLFVISETKTNSNMGSKLLKNDYNIFEETGVKTDNHHLYKWGIVVGVRKDLQISQKIPLSHSALAGRAIAIDIVLGTSNGRGFIHRFIGTYAPWNPGGTDNEFWPQITSICRQSPYSWTLAGDVNATVSVLERPSGGQDARQHYLRFLNRSDGQDLWTLNPDRTRDHDWTCRARGSTGGGNIIDRIVLSNKGFSDTKIRVADRSSDYVPMTDHRAVIGFMIIQPPPDSLLAASHIKFSKDTAASYGKPRLRYPLSSERHKFEDFRIMVDEEIKAKSIHTLPVIDDESFILRYNALSKILNECGDAIFGRVKRNKHNANSRVTSPAIQQIQSKIRHLGGALQITQESFSGEVSHTSLMVYQ